MYKLHIRTTYHQRASIFRNCAEFWLNKKINYWLQYKRHLACRTAEFYLLISQKSLYIAVELSKLDPEQ